MAKGYPPKEDQTPSLHPVGLGALTHCPECGGQLTSVTHGDVTDFRCDQCGRFWHVELGYVHEVED